MDRVDKKLRLNHLRFQQITAEQIGQLNPFFVGQFLAIDTIPADGNLQLPLELYDPVCFGTPTPEEQLLHCPLVLQP